MGEFADRVGERLRADLDARTDRAWTSEHYVARTPVDVAAPGDPDLLVELEFRRADPANNPVKVARHAAAGAIGNCVLIQAFSAYYDTAEGVSSKRENAEFVGALADGALDGFAYRPVDLELRPPKRGDDPPTDWEEAVAALAAAVVDALADASVDVDPV